MWLFAGFLAVPLIEIALFVTVGGWIGLWPTLGIVVGTAILGVAVIRRQGAQALEGLRQAGQMRRNPLGQIAENALVGMAGVLLILPGFLTDSLGLLLLIPPVRQLVIRSFAARAQVYGAASFDGPRRSGPDVIDGEYFEIEQDQPEVQRDDRRYPEGRFPADWRH